VSRISGCPRVFVSTLVMALVAAGISAFATAPAMAATSGPDPVCGPTTCTQTFGYTGSLASFVVPANVSSVQVTVAAGQGGAYKYGGGGGGGGYVSGTLPVTVGGLFQVLAGAAGNTFGGGGQTGSGGGAGGGGSFVFTPSGAPLLAAGGGGGGGYAAQGGYGSGATTTGGNGQINQFASPAVAPTGGSQTSPGAGGSWDNYVYGTAGTGPAANTAPGVGGAGGQFFGDGGGAGGGGYYGGGGGAIFEGGGGGSGYADPSVTVTTSTDGANGGNGWVSFTWQKEPSTTMLSVSPPTESGAGTPITLTATVAGAVGATTGSVDFHNGSSTIPGCAGQPLNVSGIATCTATLPSGADTVTASYLGDTTYAVSQSAGMPYTVYAPLQITTSSLPDPTFGSAYTVDLAATGGKDPYDWTAMAASLPAGLTLSSSGVLSGTPTQTGAFTAHVVLSDSLNPAETTSADLPFTVDKAAQQVTFTSSAPTNALVGGTYDVSAAGGASNNPVLFTTGADGNCSIIGGTVTFLHAGTCTVLADQAGNGDYAAAPQQTQQIAVGQGAQAINFLSVAPNSAVVGGTYNVSTSGGSSGQPVTLTATPASCTVNGNTVTFTHVGNCVITADQTGNSDFMAAPSSNQTITVGQAAQTITFAPLTSPATVGDNQSLTAVGGASGNPVTFTVAPTTTGSACSIIGTTLTFDHAGTCVVDADQGGNADYLAAPQAQQMIAVGQGAQTITFAPLASPATVGDEQSLTAVGGASGNPVDFTVAPTTTGSACSISGTTLSFDDAGSCVVVADQGGNADYTAAPEVSQTVTVGLASTSVSVTLSPGVTVFGQGATATATVGGAQAGSIQFSVDGTDLGAPVTVSNGQATSPAMGTLTPGGHQVGAVFTPLEASKYAPSSATPQTLVVDQAATTATITVRAHSIAATIAPVSPGAGRPSGTVTFTVDGSPVGTATLVGGVATLSYALPTDKADQVAVQYQGDPDFLASSATTTRHSPTIKATLTSAHPKSTSGWYRTQVTARFTCATNVAALVSGCPQPVTLTRNGAAQSVSRTITAVDGGAATVSITGINIDQARPTVAITGVRTRRPYFASAPRGHCTARDGLSGIASCSISQRRIGARVVYTATAVDKAGNVSTTRLTARVAKYMIKGAGFRKGAYVVRAGQTYTILATARTRPRYVDAMPYPRAPQGLDNPFIKTGRNRWAIGVTFSSAMLKQRHWHIGVRVGGHTHVLTVRVVH
jgi:hypothetical protein